MLGRDVPKSNGRQGRDLAVTVLFVPSLLSSGVQFRAVLRLQNPPRLVRHAVVVSAYTSSHKAIAARLKESLERFGIPFSLWEVPAGMCGNRAAADGDRVRDAMAASGAHPRVRQRLCVLPHRTYRLISFRKATPPQNRQLIAYL